MKRFVKLCLLLIMSLTIGAVIAPLFKIETVTDRNSINEPESRPLQQYKDRYGDDIRRIV
jgi:hypothetical protein